MLTRRLACSLASRSSADCCVLSRSPSGWDSACRSAWRLGTLQGSLAICCLEAGLAGILCCVLVKLPVKLPAGCAGACCGELMQLLGSCSAAASEDALLPGTGLTLTLS